MPEPANASRMLRYQVIFDAARVSDSFELDQIKSTCRDEKPGFVTRVINELAREGWLVRDEESTRYKWSVDPQSLVENRWIEKKISGNKITAAPAKDRPRERLLALGAINLRSAELIAILVRSGRQGESALQAGEKVANQFRDCIDKLPDAAPGELKQISHAIADSAYCQIMAGIELGRRVAEAKQSNPSIDRIRSTTEALSFCEHKFRRLSSDSAREEFHIVTLGTKNQVIATHQISVGTLDASLVHPREVFRAAVKDAASSIILVHNHPSGDPTPSKEDRAVTTRLEQAGDLMGIQVLDHVIVTAFRCVSLRESE